MFWIDRSYRLDIVRVERESFELFFQLQGVFFANNIVKLNLLEHLIREQRNPVTCLEIFLANMDKGLYYYCLCVFSSIFSEHLAHEVIYVFACLLRKFYSLLNLFGRSSVVFFVEIKISIHVKFTNFENFHIKILRMLIQLKIFHPNINVW